MHLAEGADRCGHFTLGTGSLHGGMDERHLEAVAAPAENRHEVAMRGAALRRDQPDAQRHFVERALLVARQEPLVTQEAQRLVTALRERAQRRDRVDVTHHELQPAVRRIEVERTEHAQRLPFVDGDAGALELPADAHAVAAKQNGIELRLDPVMRPLLDELEVEVTVAIAAGSLHLAPDPDQAEDLAQNRLDLGTELGDPVGVGGERVPSGRRGQGR